MSDPQPSDARETRGPTSSPAAEAGSECGTGLGMAVVQAVVICVLGSFIGAGIHWDALTTGQFIPPSPIAREPWRVQLPDLLRDYRQGRVLVVDVRPKAEYEAEHIAGAIYLDSANFQKVIGTMGRWLPTDSMIALMATKDERDNRRASHALQGMGYTWVRYIYEPLSEWKAAGGATARGWDMGPLLEARP